MAGRGVTSGATPVPASYRGESVSWSALRTRVCRPGAAPAGLTRHLEKRSMSTETGVWCWRRREARRVKGKSSRCRPRAWLSSRHHLHLLSVLLTSFSRKGTALDVGSVLLLRKGGLKDVSLSRRTTLSRRDRRRRTCRILRCFTTASSARVRVYAGGSVRAASGAVWAGTLRRCS